MKLKFLLAALLYVICFPAVAQEDKTNWLSFEPEIVVLEGLLKLKPFVGPSTSGKNSAVQIEVALIVMLSTPISVRRNDNDPLNGEDVENVIRVQLACGRERSDCPRFANKRVRVTGSLFTAHTGHHRAKILMAVSEISKIE